MNFKTAWWWNNPADSYLCLSVLRKWNALSTYRVLIDKIANLSFWKGEFAFFWTGSWHRVTPRKWDHNLLVLCSVIWPIGFGKYGNIINIFWKLAIFCVLWDRWSTIGAIITRDISRDISGRVFDIVRNGSERAVFHFVPLFLAKYSAKIANQKK